MSLFEQRKCRARCRGTELESAAPHRKAANAVLNGAEFVVRSEEGGN